MEKTTTSTRRRRARSTAGALGLGVLVLVGCASTIDGRASVGQELLGSVGVDPSASDSPSAPSSATETSDPAESDPAESDAGDAPATADPSTGSGNSADPTSSTAGSSPTSSTSASTSSTSSTAAVPPAGTPDTSGLTEPGSQLTYGAPAVLPFTYADAEGVFTISGLTVTRGSEADWATLGVDTSDAQGEEPWFLRMTVRQDSGGDFSYIGVQDDLYAYGPDDDILSTVYLDDDQNTLCPSTTAPADFAVGQSYDTCVVLSVNLGESVDRVQYEGGFDPDDPYYESPVSWRG